MKCKNCGYEFKGQNYCPICGEMDLIYDNEIKEVKEESNTNNNQSVGNQYKVFAIIGYVVGILSLAFCWAPFMFFNGIVGIIFSKVGDKPTNKQEYAKKGFKLSLIGTIINIIVTVVFIVVVAILAVEYGDDVLDKINW